MTPLRSIFGCTRIFLFVIRKQICLPVILLVKLAFTQVANGQVQRLPEFHFLRLSDGKPFTQRDLQPPKKTLFVFFDTECPHCMQAVSTWNDNHSAMDGLHTVLLTMDPPEAAIPFLRKFADKIISKKQVVTARDPDRQFISRFLPKKYPSMFLFSEKGILLRYTDDEKDIPSLIRLIPKK